MMRSPPIPRKPVMRASKAPTLGTTSPPALSAAVQVSGDLDIGAHSLRAR